jgi:fucose permease
MRERETHTHTVSSGSSAWYYCSHMIPHKILLIVLFLLHRYHEVREKTKEQKKERKKECFLVCFTASHIIPVCVYIYIYT